MNVTKAQEKSPARQQQQQQQGTASQAATLKDRYGKIGISAVAGACQHKGETRRATENRFIPRDSD